MVFLPIRFEILKKKKKGRRIKIIVVASLISKRVGGMGKKILCFYKLSGFSPQILICFKGHLLCPPLKTALLAVHFKDQCPVTAVSPSKYSAAGFETTSRHQPSQPQGTLSDHSHGCLYDLFQKLFKDGETTFS